MLRRLTLSVLSAAALGACATQPPPPPAQAYSPYGPYPGAPVPGATYYSTATAPAAVVPAGSVAAPSAIAQVPFTPPAGARAGDCYARTGDRYDWSRVACPTATAQAAPAAPTQGYAYPSSIYQPNNVGPWGRPGYGYYSAYYAYPGYGSTYAQQANPYGASGWSGYGRAWPSPYDTAGDLIWPGKSPGPVSPAAPGY